LQKNATSLPVTTLALSTTIKISSKVSVSTVNESKIPFKKRQALPLFQKWIKSSTPLANKHQKSFSLFSKFNYRNSTINDYSDKLKKHKISIQAVQPVQASFLL